jgi:tryptophanyl-tRNA synthetase
LFGFLEGGGRVILTEPEAMLTPTPKMPGIDGQKMSKSYHNTISLRDDLTEVEQKLRTMPTDPARVRRSDPGDPDKCPVWQLHEVYSSEPVKAWVQTGCREAGIGCVDCKQPVVEAVRAELESIQERAREFEGDLDSVKAIVADGCVTARAEARKTMADVRSAMGLDYL